MREQNIDDSFESYMKDSVDIDDMDLDNEFIRVSSDLSYWYSKLADATESYQHAKFVREQVHARVYSEKKKFLHESYMDKKVKPPTVQDIESSVILDEEFSISKEKEIDAESFKLKIYGIVEAVKSKKDMLIQIGANRRADINGHISINKK